MVTLLTIQVLSIIATALTNLIGILAFATDYWSIIVYDIDKIYSLAKWTAVENSTTGDIQIHHYYQHDNNDRNRTERQRIFNDEQLATLVIGIDNDTILYKIHKGIFRQCNYLSVNIRQHWKLSKCRVLKLGNNQYDDAIHGMNNPGRELIRKYPMFA
jgi:hypothetical protein